MKNTTNQHHKGKKRHYLPWHFHLFWQVHPCRLPNERMSQVKLLFRVLKLWASKDSIRQQSKFCLPTTNA